MIDTNISPTRLQHHLFTQEDHDSVALVQKKAWEVCREQITANYIRKTLGRFEAGFLYTTPDTPSQISGFCLWEIRENFFRSRESKRELIVLLICGLKQEGSFLDRVLYDLDSYCREEHLPYMTLEPANESLREYYQQKGFRMLPEPMDGWMMRNVESSITLIQSNQRRRTRKRGRNAAQT